MAEWGRVPAVMQHPNPKAVEARAASSRGAGEPQDGGNCSTL